jgi:predicted phosphodiesterase
MMFAFDLISDIHADTWNNFDWSGQPTAPYCIVAGDVAEDRTRLIEVLTHLGQQYRGVFYIDGNDDHAHYLNDLTSSYRDLAEQVKNIPNVVYMQDNVIIIEDVAILATNGWWSYDFDHNIDTDQTLEWYKHKANVDHSAAMGINGIAYNDAAYMINSLHKLQQHTDINAIILVSHTVPRADLIEHDLSLVDTYRFNCMGSRPMQYALEEDTERKVKAWCFGHYHSSIDQVIDGVRYVNNCRGRGDTPWSQAAYYPKRISIKY